MKFTKMHGCSNDYVYVDCFTEKVENMGVFAKEVSDRHKGIGSDGAIFICPAEGADCEMKMYNADGSYSEMCGNGIRCVAKYVYDKGIVDKKDMTILSGGQLKKIHLEAGPERVNDLTGTSFSTREDGMAALKVRVDMGEPILEPDKIPVIFSDGCDRVISHDLFVDDSNYKVTCVSMGNPHCVVFVDHVGTVPIEQLGTKFENHLAFPNRINTEFVHVMDRQNIWMRVWERGAGETLACGTGACAAAVACILNNLTDDRVNVHLKGGDLDILWDRNNDGRVYMTGGAVTVFEGEI
ncbi:MAG: diaminopimelate epimerase [Lachnospiraceae bacterium]|nr:diaminopimelate epimerase [Lachnospiraceae bacterium]